jgi:hypothetical protein
MSESSSGAETPTADRPFIAHREYGIPDDVEGVLDWSYVVERLAQAQNYWIATISPEGNPHVRATWGSFVDGSLYFGGGPKTRWSRNLAANPRVSVHLESATEVVILEGAVGRLTEPDDPRVKRIDDAYEAKYSMRHGPPFWTLRPDVVIAWTSFPKDATRWRIRG